MTLVNILSKRARIRIPSARLAPECRVWSSLTLLSGFEVFDIFPSPFVVFDLKWQWKWDPHFIEITSDENFDCAFESGMSTLVG